MIIKLVSMLALCTSLGTLPPDRQEPTLQSLVAEQPVPVAIYVTGAGMPRPAAAATGLADPSSGRPLTVDTPLRIASNTKTFVAATVLRLHEQNRIDLDAAIGPLLDSTLTGLLKADGFDPNAMTVRQLLSHSAGLYDHGGDPRFIAAVLSDPNHVWTPRELVQLSMTYADPQAAPGVEFRYSDTGYILLGNIIERLTGQPLATVVRQSLRFDALGLTSTWWEITERQPAGAQPRARQFFDERDATDVHASFDLFGGGGLLMSARDLATFMAALFEGRVFDRKETLQIMLQQGSHRGAEGYRLGMIVKHVAGREVYFHSGFWGTVVYYDPASQTAVAGVTTRRSAFRSNVTPLVEAVLGLQPLSADCAED
nr:serine hydrolase domain-containing protein [uncultured Steroidobacter sp.]